MANTEVNSSEGDLKVYTFRDHHNAYTEGDGSGATILRRSSKFGKLDIIAQYIFGMFLVHYFLWFIPMFVILYIPTRLGYWWVSWIMLTLYLRSYYNRDELKKGRPWLWFQRHPLWRVLLGYIKLEVVRESKLDPKRQYIFGTHPHGIIILSRTAVYGDVFEKLFPGIDQRALGATPMFNLPGSREVCLWMGAVRADRSNALRVLNQHKLNLILYPGGSSEIFETDGTSKDTIVIARKGFIRLALQTGCDLVPTFAFGEKHAYHKLDLPERFKSFMMDTLRTPLIIFWGRFYTWVPLDWDKFFLSVVFGKPIRIEEKIEEPTDEQVDELYERFYGEIRNLYEKYKKRYGYDDDERLVIREAHKDDKPHARNVIKEVHAKEKDIHTNISTTVQNGKNGFTEGYFSKSANGIHNGSANPANLITVR